MPTEFPILPDRGPRQLGAEQALRRSNDLLEALTAVQSEFIADQDPGHLFNRLLEALLTLTESEYGFIGEILYADNGEPYLKTHSISNVAWNPETQALYDENVATGMRFYNLETLFGAVLTSGGPVIANDLPHHPRSGGLPKGHPAMNTFCGLPFHAGDVLIGMIGMANRPGGYDSELVDFLGPFLRTCSTLVVAFRNQQRAWQAEERLRESEARLRVIVETAGEGIVTIDEEGLIESLNGAAARLFGYAPDELIGRNVASLMPSPDRERHQEYIDNYLRTGEAQVIGNGREVQGRRKDGSTCPMYLSISEVEFGGRRIFTGILLDMTQLDRSRELELQVEQRTEELREALERQRHIAAHDELTGLPNQRMFWQQATRHQALALRNGTDLSLVVLDLDNFKRVNDSHGHRVGDRLLADVARRLLEVARESDLLARYGGEEFVLLMPEASEREAHSAAERLRVALGRSPFALQNGTEVTVTASFGVSCLHGPDDDIESLFRRADSAVYVAKQTKNAVATWNQEPAEAARRGAGLPSSPRKGRRR